MSAPVPAAPDAPPDASVVPARAPTWWRRPGLDVVDGRLSLNGVDLEALAREHGTPLFEKPSMIPCRVTVFAAGFPNSIAASIDLGGPNRLAATTRRPCTPDAAAKSRPSDRVSAQCRSSKVKVTGCNAFSEARTAPTAAPIRTDRSEPDSPASAVGTSAVCPASQPRRSISSAERPSSIALSSRLRKTGNHA